MLVKRPGLTDMPDLAMSQLLRYAMGDPRAAERTIKMLRELAWVDPAGMLDEPLEVQGRRTAQALLESPLNESETSRLLALLEMERPSIQPSLLRSRRTNTAVLGRTAGGPELGGHTLPPCWGRACMKIAGAASPGMVEFPQHPAGK